MSPVLKSFTCLAALCLCASAQEPAAKEAQANQPKGLPPRTAATEYQAQAKAGTVTIAAEFKGHSVPTMQSTLTTEDYVVVETALYGPADARIKLTADDFTLRINGKKAPLPSQPYGLVVGNVKDPEWAPPEPPEKKSKGGLSTGGQGGAGDNSPPPPPKVPIEVQRAMAKNVQKAALPEGDRALPEAGLLFFAYRGKATGIKSIELIYTGPAGKVTIPLQP
jgi:hypothetical protein